jgi:hypothetical protein
VQVMDERQDEITRVPISSIKRTDRLVEHPVLFPMLIQARCSAHSQRGPEMHCHSDGCAALQPYAE